MSTKDWIEKDFYKVLGVSKDAKPDEIKKAFRKLARDNHPDQHPGDAAAEKRFKEVSEAYSILSDPKKRKEYDDQRSMLGGFRFPGGGSGGAPGGFSGFGSGAAGPSVEDLFRNAGDQNISDLFGGLFRNSGGSRRTTRSTARRGSDIEGEVTIDFDQTVNGTTVSMQTISDTPCTACRGTGAAPGTSPEICPTCEGSGMQSSQAGGVFQMSQPCVDCLGRGLIVDDPCPHCHGSGREMSAKTMQVRIPAGVTDGQKIRIKGKGGKVRTVEYKDQEAYRVYKATPVEERGDMDNGDRRARIRLSADDLAGMDHKTGALFYHQKKTGNRILIEKDEYSRAPDPFAWMA